MAINYNFDSKTETADQYHARVAKERGGSTPLAPMPATVTPATAGEGAADRVNKFNAALNKAVDEARKQRGDATMDFLGGVVPPGALKATSMAGVLSAFNADSAPLEASLINNASQFAQDAAKIELETKSSIQELALKAAENGASPETLSMILSFTESGDLSSAIKAAGASLATKTGGKITSSGNSLVQTNADGTTSILYSADGNYQDTAGLSKTKAKEYLRQTLEPSYFQAMDAELNDDQLQSFYDFWMTINNARRMTVRADIAYKEWLEETATAKGSAGIPEKESTKKDEEEETPESVTGI